MDGKKNYKSRFINIVYWNIIMMSLSLLSNNLNLVIRDLKCFSMVY